MSDQNKRIYNHLLLDDANEVSRDEKTARKFLKDNNVDANRLAKKGIAELETLGLIKKTKNDFFKRVVLAGKIVDELHNDRNFGHVKFQKLMYLCEHVKVSRISKNYDKQAAGPFDRKFMHTIDDHFKRLKWFKIHNHSGQFSYSLSDKSEQYKKYYPNYYKEDLDIIAWLIDTFMNSSIEQVEIVATIHYCYIKMKEKQENFSEDLLIKNFYLFHKAKLRFPRERILIAYKWMIKNKLL